MPEKELLSISELTNLLNLTLEDHIGEIPFTGEVSEITRAASGHCYLTLKDAMSQVSAVIWSSKARTLPFKLESGLKVKCRGKPNVYPRTGRLQVVLSAIEPAGEGDLQKKFDLLKKKLEAEGLFSSERKRRLPFFPRALGIVTSAQGAVIHDIMVRLQERMPQLKVYLVDVRVQGLGAAEEIAAAIKYLDSKQLVDVMIVGRGGGSVEDLWSFNEEVVCRAIVNCSVPVISAVGHEVDYTLADFVADVRAPTPTAAAEMVVPRRSDLLTQLQEFERRLKDTDRWLSLKQQDFDDLAGRLDDAVRRGVDEKLQLVERLNLRIARFEPTNFLSLLANRIHLLQNKLSNAVMTTIQQRSSSLRLQQSKLTTMRVSERIEFQRVHLDRLNQRLSSQVDRLLQLHSTSVTGFEQRLKSMNSEQTLKRGFAIVYKANSLVSSSSQIATGDELSVRLSDGKIWSTVSKVEGTNG